MARLLLLIASPRAGSTNFERLLQSFEGGETFGEVFHPTGGTSSRKSAAFSTSSGSTTGTSCPGPGGGPRGGPRRSGGGLRRAAADGGGARRGRRRGEALRGLPVRPERGRDPAPIPPGLRAPSPDPDRRLHLLREGADGRGVAVGRHHRAPAEDQRPRLRLLEVEAAELLPDDELPDGAQRHRPGRRRLRGPLPGGGRRRAPAGSSWRSRASTSGSRAGRSAGAAGPGPRPGGESRELGRLRRGLSPPRARSPG